MTELVRWVSGASAAALTLWLVGACAGSCSREGPAVCKELRDTQFVYIADMMKSARSNPSPFTRGDEYGDSVQALTGLKLMQEAVGCEP